MASVTVFNSVSLDGFFCSPDGDMSWAHNPDEEWQEFTQDNARGSGILIFGRVTYDLMVSYWPTKAAMEAMPVVAERMNSAPKVVFSRTMNKAAWSNTTLVKTDPAAEVRRLKRGALDMAVMGSGSIVSLLVQAGLIDTLQIVVVPLVIGKGRTMFEGVEGKLRMKLAGTRSFRNGNVLLSYTPAG